MLVLSRRPNEAIIIDHNIRIIVTSVQGDRVKIAIDAPKQVQVDREEVYKAKNQT